MAADEYDAFISHASEDKQSFVQPLATELVRLGLHIWYDQFTLVVGDSLHESIERGLRTSKYGILVLSSSFFEKNWTKGELAALVSRQMRGAKVIFANLAWRKAKRCIGNIPASGGYRSPR